MSVFDADLGQVTQPCLVIDKATMRSNLERLVELAGGVPLRIATKSVRVRGVIEWACAHDGVEGVLAYTAAEAFWLVQHGIRNAVIAYPTVDVASVREIANDPVARHEITFMVDLPEHIRLLADVAREAGCESLRVALDIDASLRLGTMAIGVHRSSLHTPQEAGEMARVVSETPGVVLVGAMFYEAQVAGLQDLSVLHRLMKKRSLAELAERRCVVVDAIRRYADLEFVNGGGTGSIHATRLDPTVTDIAAGSGIFTSALFDRYPRLRTRPAAWFVTPVVRKPTRELAVTFSGGYIASGSGGTSRVPVPVYPPGLRYFGQEGAGEVQTPLRGPGAAQLAVGDHVWFRHAKAGEVCERFDEALFVDDGRVVETMPTYRGEGQNFG